MFRALFWLSLIVLIIWWSGGARDHKPRLLEGLKKEAADPLHNLNTFAAKRLDAATTRLEQACLQRPKFCLEVAGKYTFREAGKAPQTTSDPVPAGKVRAEGKLQNRAARSAPQGRVPAN